MDNYDKALRNLLRKKSSNIYTTEGDCLSEELLAAYFGNLLEGIEKEKVEEHLSKCKACRQNSIVLNRVKTEIEKSPVLKSPIELTDKAKHLVKGSQIKDMIEVILRFAKDSITVLKDTASMIKPLEAVPIAVRQGMAVEAKNTVFLSKKFNSVEVNLTIEHIDKEHCEIDVRTTEASTGNPLDDIRLNLIYEGKELASYLTKKGKAHFKNLDFGTYTLVIIKGKDILGEILLLLESA